MVSVLVLMFPPMDLVTGWQDTRLFTSLYGRGWGVDCDEVKPRLFCTAMFTVEHRWSRVCTLVTGAP